MPTISTAPTGEIVTLKVRVDEHAPSRNRRLPYRVRCSDEDGVMDLVFFHARQDYLSRMLPNGETRYISGKTDRYHGVLQITHPDFIVDEEEFKSIPLKQPVYPLTEGITQKVMNKIVAGAVGLVPELGEWHEAPLVNARQWADWHNAIHAAHAPQNLKDLESSAPSRQRLAYDELLSNQLALGLVRAQMKKVSGRPLKLGNQLRGKALKQLSFSPTSAQTRALKEIDQDLGAPYRMLRLLQGDVGAGKTLVAFLTMLVAIENGAQAAMMAPTEILARQHLASLQPLAEAVGVRLEILTGRERGKARDEILEKLKTKEIDILVGTHALFQETVEFDDLAVAVVDEQHRFGVHQRLALTGKGKYPVDVLVMTATPIPRTLTLTHYGDMDVSLLTEKPPGRQPIETRIISTARVDEVVEGLKRVLQSGARAYWVCPLVEESDVIDATAAEDRHRHLQQIFGDRVGLVHGRMKAQEKDAVMGAFQRGDLSILIATTVIEVGVDVPEATIMIIEHAERFGLAQLHQLRGRVGRGSAKSSCVLLYQAPLGETARARLNIMRETEDGFKIAEEDLRLRGAGELLGTRQSGLPEFKIAQLPEQDELLLMARDDVKLILENDPQLETQRGQALRTLLYLFQRDEAVKLLRSG